MDDGRKKIDSDDASFLDGEDENERDDAALRQDGRNPLAEEEKIEDDSSSSD